MRKGKLFTGKAWKRMVRILSCIVVFCTTYALILPAITQEAQAYCGNMEHEHTKECYKEILSCTREEHVHSEDCFDADGSLTCMLEEHTHSGDCYRELLECTEEEHTHSLECFSDPEADKETEEDWKKTLPDEEVLKDKTDTEKVLMIAESQKGYKESEKNYVVENVTEKKGITRYGQWDQDPYEDWAGAYARFVLHYAGIETADAKKHVSDWLEQLHDKGELKAAEEAEAGDVLFVYDEKDQLKAGIVSEVKDGTVKAWMGDWDNQVQEKTFGKTDEKVHSVWKAIQKEEPAEPKQPEGSAEPEVPAEEAQKPEETPKADEEKPAEQPKDEEPVVSYNFTQEVEAEDGAKIKVSWNAGTFETEDVVFQAKKVELTEEEQKKVQDQLDKDKSYTFRNYDLTFYVRDGNMELQKVEPMQPVHVEIEYPVDLKEYVVFHHNDMCNVEQIENTSSESVKEDGGATITFESNRFSVFTVATISQFDNYIPISNNQEGYDALVHYANGTKKLENNQYLRLEENVWVPNNWGTGTITVNQDYRLDLNGFVLTNNKTSTLFNITGGNVEILSSKSPSESSFNGSTVNNGVNTTNKTISFNIDSNKGVTVSNVGILVAKAGGDVVKVTGGSLTMENMAVTGVNDASAVYEHGRTVTLSNCYLVNGKRGLYADGGSVTIKDGYIANNLTSGGFDQAGAAIQAINRANICLGNDVVENNTSTCTNVQYNRFTNAESRSYGGAIHLRGSELTIKNALIQKNQISGTDWVCGGAIAALCNDRDNQSGDGNEWTWGTPSKITMYKPAIIDGNTAQAGGGGIFLQGPRVGGDAPTGFDNASKFFMFGGTISNNTATNNEGGGIHQGATYRSYAYLFAGEISGNKTTTSQHWGGGGIFVGEESYMMLPNGASVSSNTAQGLGGGVAACSTGNIIFDENVVMAQNTSHANAWTGSSTQKPYDRTLAQGHAGFQNAGDARDFFSALYASVSGELPNDLGGNNWSGSVDYNLVTNVNTGTLTANQLMGLVNNAPADVQTAALSLSPLKIAGNTSSVHGGGILVNGYMIGGDVEYLPSGPTINFQADKRLLNKDGNQIDLGNNVFEFELLENSEIIAEGKNDANGLITFSPPVVYMPDMTSVTPGNDYSWETSTIFVMREKQDSSSSFEMSKAQYNISLRYRTTLTYVLTYPVYNTQGEHVKDVRVFRADSVIVDDSLKVTDNDGNTVHAALEQADPNLSDGHNYTFNNKILHINPGNPDFINQEIPKKDITVRKVWRNQSGEIFVPNQGMKVTFDLYRKEIGAASYPESPHDSIDLPTDDGAWEYTFQELDSHYEYEVRERNPNPLYDVSHTVSNTVSGSIWVKANHLETNKPYLIGSKDAAGNIVLLSKDSSPYDEDVHRFRSEDKVTLNNEKGKLVTIEGHSYSDAFEYDIPITNNPCYFAKNVNFQGTEGYALVNSSNDSYTRAENWTNGNKSGLMLTDLSGLTEQDRSVSVNTEGIISQKLDGENKTYNYDKTFNWFSTTTKTTSNYNDAYLYEQKPYTKEDPTHSVWTFTNQRRSDYKLVINKIDGETKETLNGVKFELYSSENSIVQFSFVNGIYKADTNGVFTELVTNTDGKITITGLQEGTYSLKETYASQGYVIPEDTISIRINGQLDSADGNEDMVINKTIENHMAYELPETGSAGTKVTLE